MKSTYHHNDVGYSSFQRTFIFLIFHEWIENGGGSLHQVPPPPVRTWWSECICACSNVSRVELAGSVMLSRRDAQQGILIIIDP